MSKSELLNKIAVALGGRAAEEIKFGDISTGAHNDLARATDIARSMVKEYGMSAELGHFYFEDVEFRNYRILGACNPPFAYQALQAEDKIGTMLPCNMVVQENAEGKVEVAAVDPVASMQAIDNPKLRDIAGQVRAKLKSVVDGL